MPRTVHRSGISIRCFECAGKSTTYADGKCLDDEAEHVEPKLAVGRKRDTSRDHAYDRKQPSVRFLDSEHERDEKNSHRVESLPGGKKSGLGQLRNSQAWGAELGGLRPLFAVLTLSIWMKETVRCKYALLLRMRLPLKRRPMGRIDRTNMSLDMWISFAPSSKWVVLCKIRVPIAYKKPKRRQYVF